MVCAATLLTPPFQAHSEESHPTETSAWNELASMQLVDAHTSFAQLAREKPNERSIALGLGLSLLNLQPKVEGNIEKATSIFEKLQTENPSDDIGIQAQYLLARIQELHRFQPDREEAIRRYADLSTQHPDHLFAQIGFVKRANLLIYAPGTEAASKAALLQDLEASSTFLTHPAALRDYHTSMAMAYLRFEVSQANALRHLLEAEKAGVLRSSARSDLYLQIATLLEEEGRPTESVAYYRKFLTNSRRDGRSYMVKQRIAELEKQTP